MPHRCCIHSALPTHPGPQSIFSQCIKLCPAVRSVLSRIKAGYERGMESCERQVLFWMRVCH